MCLHVILGAEFNWQDALNLESCLTQDEIMMRYCRSSLTAMPDGLCVDVSSCPCNNHFCG